ncbi:hypothetical protein LTR74_018372 [Friedmanniomyces endolithicus]|nr:hypothetical protein LTR74_018372 [Friedmanniomyces endolithicus]
MRKHCQNKPNIGHAIFYFSFSDDDKQTYQNLLLSLVVQLGNREVSLSMLRQAYQKVERGQPRLHKLQEILLSSIASYNQVFIYLDALDESREGEGVRQKVLDGSEELLRRIPNVGMLITSRDMPDIRRVMEELRVEMFPIANQLVNADIRKYVSTRWSRDCKLSRLDHATRTLVEETLVRKADGMFRWVYCQLAELTKSKSTKPKSVQAALLALPKDLYETYEHMLNRISKDDRCHALTLLRWLAYSRSPLGLIELAEAATIDPTDDVFVDGFVDTKNRDHWEDTLDILTGLITIDRADEGEVDDDNGRPAAMNDSRDRSVVQNHQRIGKNTKITLAHSSVKEYLESPHVMTSEAKDFRFDPAREHTILSQSCLVYLSHYSGSSEKTSTDEDLAAFPMLYYAAKTWSHHALLQQCRSSNRQLALLTSNSRKRNWLLVHDPDRPWDRPFESSLTSVGTALYYASQLGLLMAAQELLSVGVDIEAQGGRYGTALQVATARGHLKIMQLLLNHDADVNAQKGYSSTPLRAASAGGHLGIVQLLLYHNADVNTQKGYFCTPLAEGGFYGTALQTASSGGYPEIVRLLLNHKANFHAPGGEYGTALQAALDRGHEEVVQMLLDAGATVDA